MMLMSIVLYEVRDVVRCVDMPLCCQFLVITVLLVQLETPTTALLITTTKGR